MRNLKTFLNDIIKQPPVLFPCVVLFHLVFLLWAIWTCVQQPAMSTEINVLWMLAYTIGWIGVADQKKWGAFTYVGLTVVNIILYLTLKTPHDRENYISALFITDILFCFFILFYFKRFR